MLGIPVLKIIIWGGILLDIPPQMEGLNNIHDGYSHSKAVHVEISILK